MSKFRLITSQCQRKWQKLKLYIFHNLRSGKSLRVINYDLSMEYIMTHNILHWKVPDIPILPQSRGSQTLLRLPKILHAFARQMPPSTNRCRWAKSAVSAFLKDKLLISCFCRALAKYFTGYNFIFWKHLYLILPIYYNSAYTVCRGKHLSLWQDVEAHGSVRRRGSYIF